jgi:hypothetical protein
MVHTAKSAGTMHIIMHHPSCQVIFDSIPKCLPATKNSPAFTNTAQPRHATNPAPVELRSAQQLHPVRRTQAAIVLKPPLVLKPYELATLVQTGASTKLSILLLQSYFFHLWTCNLSGQTLNERRRQINKGSQDGSTLTIRV